MKVLLLGNDARTDATAQACTPSGAELHFYGTLANPGLLDRCASFGRGSLTDVAAMVAHARSLAPDLVIVGPEAPLAAGVVDALAEAGIAAFGPRQDLARIESSKAWTRELVDRHGIAGNPAHRVCRSAAEVDDFCRAVGDVVVKPDGLTGGKGVRVMGEHLADVAEAAAYAGDLLAEHGSVVLEERLVGQEFSFMTVTDGEAAVHCPVVQDHKRAFAGDTGPNTGGMGTYSFADHSLPFLDPAELAGAAAINEAVVAALAAETGLPYRGVLYGGFMATAGGLRLIEYNARFGDPEAMNVLAVLDADMVEMCAAVAAGRLGTVPVAFAPLATVCKYVVPSGYPDDPHGGEISLGAAAESGARVAWAACERRPDGSVHMTGSRAVALTGVAATLDEAERIAESAASAVHGDVRHRSDIGTAGAISRRTAHMASLRGSQAV